MQNIFKFTVVNNKEYHNMIPGYERKERKYINICKKVGVEDKSKLQVIRKIGGFLEDRFHFCIRFTGKTLKTGLYLFVVLNF